MIRNCRDLFAVSRAAAVVCLLTPLVAQGQQQAPAPERSRTEGLKETDRFIKAGTQASSAVTAAKVEVEKTLTAYNITSFSPSAGEVLDEVRRAFPDARVGFEPDVKRQKIVDSWPADVDDSRARADWGWRPDYDQRRAFDEYLVPNIRARYAG